MSPRDGRCALTSFTLPRFPRYCHALVGPDNYLPVLECRSVSTLKPLALSSAIISGDQL
jgi:hypothetical protein